MKAIAIMYEDTSAKVITPDGETEMFSILAGVLQVIMRKALMGREDKLGFQLRKRQSRRVPPLTITDMDFADDIALVSKDIKRAEEMLKRVELSSKCIELNMNKDKTQ